MTYANLYILFIMIFIYVIYHGISQWTYLEAALYKFCLVYNCSWSENWPHNGQFCLICFCFLSPSMTANDDLIHGFMFSIHSILSLHWAFNQGTVPCIISFSSLHSSAAHAQKFVLLYITYFCECNSFQPLLVSFGVNLPDVWLTTQFCRWGSRIMVLPLRATSDSLNFDTAPFWATTASV